MLRRIAYGNADARDRARRRRVLGADAAAGLRRARRAPRSSDFDWSAVSDAEARALAVPTLVILGRSDRLMRNAERAARRLAGATVHVLAGGHCVHEEQPAKRIGVIGEFLARVWRTSTLALSDTMS